MTCEDCMFSAPEKLHDGNTFCRDDDGNYIFPYVCCRFPQFVGKMADDCCGEYKERCQYVYGEEH